MASLLVRLCAAAVLVVAAGLKTLALLDGSASANVGGWPAGVEAAAVAGELALAAWLVSGLWARAAWAAAALAFGLFGFVSLHKALAGAESCGCFGRLAVSPWVTLALDATLLTALLVVGPPRFASRPTRRRLITWATLAAVVALVGPAAFLLRGQPATLAADGVIVGEGRLVVLEPDKWRAGQRLPVLDHIEMNDPDDDLSAGRWHVVFFRHDCDTCRANMPAYEAMARADPSRPVALVEVEPARGVPIVSSASACRLGRLADARRWFVQTPAAVDLIDGGVAR